MGGAGGNILESLSLIKLNTHIRTHTQTHTNLSVSFSNFLAIILHTYTVLVSVLNAEPDQRRVYLSLGRASAECRLLSPRGATREKRDSQ